MLLATWVLRTWIAVAPESAVAADAAKPGVAVPEPAVAADAHAELGVLLREPALDQPGVDVAVPPAVAAGVGVGLVFGRHPTRPRAWLDARVVSSVAGRAIESLADGSRRARPARSQVVRASFGVVLTARPQVQIGLGLGYVLRTFTSAIDERIPAQLIHAPQLVMPLVFSSRRGRVALRLRPALGPSLAAAALAQRSEHDVGLAIGLAVELDVRLLGPLALRISATEQHDLFFPLHDAQHLATLALVFDANPWIRPRP
jgi:hypothetical protein